VLIYIQYLLINYLILLKNFEKKKILKDENIPVYEKWGLLNDKKN